MEQQPARSEYKKVWSSLSATEDQAKLNVIGVTDEAAFQATGEQTLRFLQESVGIRKDDVVLEIGYGIGRVDKLVAALPALTNPDRTLPREQRRWCCSHHAQLRCSCQVSAPR
jgi:hypothetical protein